MQSCLPPVPNRACKCLAECSKPPDYKCHYHRLRTTVTTLLLMFQLVVDLHSFGRFKHTDSERPTAAPANQKIRSAACAASRRDRHGSKTSLNLTSKVKHLLRAGHRISTQQILNLVKDSILTGAEKTQFRRPILKHLPLRGHPFAQLLHAMARFTAFQSSRPFAQLYFGPRALGRAHCTCRVQSV